MKSTSTFAIASLLFLAANTAFAQAAPNDAQIAGIVVAANTIDITAGQLAKKKSTNKDVKEFAQRMIVDHSGVNKQAVALVTKLHVKPEDSAISKSLNEDAAATQKRLQGLSGAAFDKAYVDNEVAYHQAVLDAIDKVLLPNASNAELKILIANVRPAIDAHLAHAKHMQSMMR